MPCPSPMDGWLWMRRACRRAPMPPEKQIGAGTGSNLESWTHRLRLSVAYLQYNHGDVRLDAEGTACNDAAGWTAGDAAEGGPEGRRCLE
ncbi:unnamed protein product [Miscanthus lutarioriparius]|uniref:Uncharacterized protein n=1 Tax=Miscanthus lutarioriparius TaxID=422564 RepID=A0A811R1K9_9POAL|nr:unnamed protein product [Miscanthus lutarioriparius]CAD6341672.1 unnamed protein product [Miscanthus lutarioriparius]